MDPNFIQFIERFYLLEDHLTHTEVLDILVI